MLRFAVALLIGLVVLWALTTSAFAQEPPTVGWYSIPLGPHGTIATPSRYCENDFDVVNTYVIGGVKPDRFCVQLTGPSSGAIFDPAFRVTDVYGEPEVSPTLEYGWACWYSYQLGTLYEVGSPLMIAGWFVTYDIQVGYPHIDQEVFQNVRAYVGEDEYAGAAGISQWMYDECRPYDVYLPVILK